MERWSYIGHSSYDRGAKATGVFVVGAENQVIDAALEGLEGVVADDCMVVGLLVYQVYPVFYEQVEALCD